MHILMPVRKDNKTEKSYSRRLYVLHMCTETWASTDQEGTTWAEWSEAAREVSLK